MPAINSILNRVASVYSGTLSEVRKFLADFLRTAFSTYHPEAHYMRGPGPAYAAKKAIGRRSFRADPSNCDGEQKPPLSALR